MRRSSCALTTLVLSGCTWPEVLVPVLQHTSALRYRLVEAILLPRYVPTPFLAYGYGLHLGFAHRASPFFSMVRPRLSGRCPLTFARVITVYSDTKLRGVTESCVHELAADGLDIDIAFLAGAEAHGSS
ncbi:hypothetical protein B0H13DRAFT_2309001 [Mycena leptocephala]|nr:hypothetical protein B0H13DRAFT_2309001 [Mycena leptocephala]